MYVTYATNRLFGDNWSLAFFGALASVGALFVLLGGKDGKTEKDNDMVICCIGFYYGAFYCCHGTIDFCTV